MTIYTEAPLNMFAARIHRSLPEIENPNLAGLLVVPEGGVVSGNRKNVFISFGFSECTGIILENDDRTKFGLIHLYPGEEIEKLDLPALDTLKGASARLIEGSNSTGKTRQLYRLRDIYEFNYTKTLEVDTCKGERRDGMFHLSYRPCCNEVIVARISHKDFQTFKAF